MPFSFRPQAAAGEVRRATLLTRLHHLQTPVITLAGPSGAGKSTAAAQWTRERPEQAVWVQGHPAHIDPALFLSDLGASLQDSGIVLGSFLRASLHNRPHEELVAALADDLNASEDAVLLCVDDAEQLSPEATRLLAFLASTLRTGHRLLLTHPPHRPFEAAPFLPDEAVSRLGQEALWPTPDEVGRLLEGGDSARSRPDILSLHLWAHTGGLEDDAACFTHLISQLTPDEREALPTLGVLQAWTPEALRAFGLPLDETNFSHMHATGLPIRFTQKGWVLHERFCAELRRQLADDPHRWQAIHLQAAQYEEREGRLLSALILSSRGHLARLTRRLLDALTPRWAQQQEWSLLSAVLQSVPSGHLTPAHRGLLGLALVESGEGERGAQVAQDTPHPVAHLALGLHAYRTGAIPEMLGHVNAGLTLASQTWEVIQLLRFRAIAHAALNETSAAMQDVDEAIYRAQGIHDQGLQLAGLGVKGFLQDQSGASECALQTYEQVYQLGTRLGLTRRITPALDQLSQLYLRQRRTVDARRVLEDHLKTCQVTAPLALAGLQTRLVQVQYLQGEAAPALHLAQATFEHAMAQGDLLTASQVALFLLPRLVVDGEYRRAVLVQSHLYARLKWQTHPELRATHEVLGAYLTYGAGDAAQAAHQAAACLRETKGAPRSSTSVLAHLLLARIAYETNCLEGHSPQGLLDALDQDPMEYAVLRMLRAWMAPALAAWSQLNPNHIALRELGTRAPVDESETPQLHLMTFGGASVQLNGTLIQVGTNANMEALVYRAFHPEARQDMIADAVWPGRELKRARASAQVARTTINASVREAIQTRWPGIRLDLLTSGAQGQRNPEWCWNPEVRLTSDVDALLAATTPERVLALRPGPFLPHSAHEWVLEWRELTDTHAATVFMRAAREAGAGREGMRWAMHAAVTGASPEAYTLLEAYAQASGEAPEPQWRQTLDELRIGHPLGTDPTWLN